MQYKYCPRCGGHLEERIVGENGRARLICKDCDFIFYINPTPAAAVILLLNNEVLLVKRKFEPRSGDWSLPSGFLENDETVEQAAIREVKEETNLSIKLRSLFGVHSSFHDPNAHVLLVVYRGEIIDGELKAGDDAIEAKFFPLDDLPENIAFKCHRKVLDELIKEKENLLN